MLPRYRLLVEKLAQQGLLPVICGTDTLGVGINVPIHTVVLTALTKFDGHKMRRLRAREFHQIVGRAGRSGFDTEGMVIAEAPEHDIENAKLVAKAGDDLKKLRKIKKKQPPEGFVTWNKQTFERLIAAVPETLKPRMKITHSMVLSEVVQGGDAYARVRKLIADSAQTDEEKAALSVRADEIFNTLANADVIEQVEGEDGAVEYVTTVDLPEDFALDQPLSPFLLAASGTSGPRERDLRVRRHIHGRSHAGGPAAGTARPGARGARQGHGRHEGRRGGVRGAPGASGRGHVPAAAGGLAGGGVRTATAPEVPWAQRLRAGAEVGAARHAGGRERTSRATWPRYGIARSEGTLLRYLADAYRVLDRTDSAPRSATSGWRISSHGSASWCARWTRAWWTSGRARVRCLRGRPAPCGRRRRSARPSRPHRARAQRALPAACGWRRRRTRGGARGKLDQRVGLRRAALAARRSTRTSRCMRPSCHRCRRPLGGLPGDRRGATRRRSACGTCTRSSATRKATTTSPSQPTWIWTPPRRKARPCSRTTAWASPEELGE